MLREPAVVYPPCLPTTESSIQSKVARNLHKIATQLFYPTHAVDHNPTGVASFPTIRARMYEANPTHGHPTSPEEYFG